LSRETSYPDKLKRAVHLLFFKRGRKPGAREWELKSTIGKRHQEVLKNLNEILDEMDLEIHEFEEEEKESKIGKPSPESRRYLVRLKGTLQPKEAKLLGWRIDNLAALAIALSIVISKQGKVERAEIEHIVGEKLGKWRSMTLVDSIIRNGYLTEDKEGMISLGWRTKAEVDLKALMTLMVSGSPSEK
jgi:hypothetical protein